MTRTPWIVLAAIVVAIATACYRGPGDIMDTALRARVEQLKADVAAEPTTPQTLPDRLDVLWRWANAYAQSGGALPVDLPQQAGRLRTAIATGGGTPARSLSAFDAYVRELTLKDERPDALGTLHFASTDALTVGSRQTIEQIYTVGAMPIEPGGVVLVARQQVTDGGLAQHEDPTGDNYVSARCSNPAATLKPIRVPLRGTHGGFYGTSPELPAFELQGAALGPGETITVTYGDTSGGSRGFKIQTWSTDRLLLPLYIDPDGSGLLLTSHWPGLEVVGNRVHAVRAVAPSVVAVGERFELTIHSEDRYFNRATGSIPAWDVLLNGEPFRRIEAGNDAIAVISNLAVDEPGVYRFTVHSEDGSITASSNPVWVRDNPDHRVYWGETHAHTDFAEGQGSPEHYLRYGRDDARLDFLTHSEHDLWLDDSEWKRMQELARTYTDEGRVIAFVGYEWTVARALGGHHNVLFRTPDRQRVGIHRAPLLPDLYRILAAENDPGDVLIIPHAHQPGDWTRNDPNMERLVEMYSMHGTFEWFGNFYLRNGFRVGFIGGSDDHRARPGYATGLSIPWVPLVQLGGLAAVIAPEKTADAIFDAMRDLSAYATSGQRIILDAALNGSRMGSIQDDTDQRQINCTVLGTSPIDHVDVIKNGEVVFSRHYLTAPLASRSRILVGFESSSEVFGDVRDNPRAYRVWNGTLQVDGARVVNVSTPGFDNGYLERAAVEADNPNLILFSTRTRGRRDTMLVELEEASAATAFTFHIEPAREVGQPAGSVRPPADIPAADLRLRLASLVNDRIEHELEEGLHTDRITLEVIEPDGALDMDFEFTDVENPRPGDYYYVRVTQLDGGRAWSSPFWVGEKDE